MQRARVAGKLESESDASRKAHPSQSQLHYESIPLSTPQSHHIDSDDPTINGSIPSLTVQ